MQMMGVKLGLSH